MDSKQKEIKIVIAAGGTGGHIFPALSVALQCRKSFALVSLLWIGTTRNREVELCELHGIPLVLVDVAGIERKFTIKSIKALLNFLVEMFRIRSLFIKNKPHAVIAFGGYVCAPVLGAARLLKVPFFIHEQNTVLGMVNRFYFNAARKVFLGFPLVGKKSHGSRTIITGTPVRSNESGYDHFSYPFKFDKKKKTILICGGSQGAQSMNLHLVKPAQLWVSQGFQVVWQTGNAGYEDVVNAVSGKTGVFIFPLISDVYPYYAVAKTVICRAGASTLAEVAYFGLPCVMIPLPWATENHQWMNAGVVESQGWGIRIKQDDQCDSFVQQALVQILGDAGEFETMSRKALDNSPICAAQIIAETIVKVINQ
jgi:UDP-N-acetylglucosamine--N-acetylmuramyl-(pentapeptide) pyrophosphoryl-undecaprenol N-acetylglucosamine transferase